MTADSRSDRMLIATRRRQSDSTQRGAYAVMHWPVRMEDRKEKIELFILTPSLRRNEIIVGHDWQEIGWLGIQPEEAGKPTNTVNTGLPNLLLFHFFLFSLVHSTSLSDTSDIPTLSALSLRAVIYCGGSLPEYTYNRSLGQNWRPSIAFTAIQSSRPQKN